MNWQTLSNAPLPGTFLSSIEAINDGGVLLLALGDDPSKAFRILLLRSGTRVFGYVNRCAHFGVPLAEHMQHLHFEPHSHFLCNVHYARYRWQDGHCIDGECNGEHLIQLPLEVIDGNIHIARESAPPAHG